MKGTLFFEWLFSVVYFYYLFVTLLKLSGYLIAKVNLHCYKTFIENLIQLSVALCIFEISFRIGVGRSGFKVIYYLRSLRYPFPRLRIYSWICVLFDQWGFTLQFFFNFHITHPQAVVNPYFLHTRPEVRWFEIPPR